MLSSKIDTYIMLFAIYLDGTVYISELFWNFLSFIHNNRIIMGGHFFLSTHCMPGYSLIDKNSVNFGRSTVSRCQSSKVQEVLFARQTFERLKDMTPQISLVQVRNRLLSCFDR